AVKFGAKMPLRDSRKTGFVAAGFADQKNGKIGFGERGPPNGGEKRDQLGARACAPDFEQARRRTQAFAELRPFRWHRQPKIRQARRKFGLDVAAQTVRRDPAAAVK